ncbi:MAG: hypothetical protein WAV25_02170 [Minisyncoccia bacterium]
MADIKKPVGDNARHAVEISSIVIFIYLIWVIFERIQQYFLYADLGSLSDWWARLAAYFWTHMMPIIGIIGVFVVILCTIGIIYNIRKLNKIIEEEKLLYGHNEDIFGLGVDETFVNEKWEKVQKNINSLNQSDWKLAIIEADVMLDDLLKASGYHGDTLGEMLKSVEKSDFVTIEAAWEAHKIRNQIAHDGSGFDLTDREAKRVIALYESVFKEFKII